MNRPIPPPPPRKKNDIDSYIQTKNETSKHKYSLEDIDDDDDDDIDIDESVDESNISSLKEDSSLMTDNDSILAMAQRLDAASVISDPSFIEGPEPHLGGLDPLGGGAPGGGRGMGNAGNGGYSGGMYRRDRDLDSIASEDEEDMDDESEFTEETPPRMRQQPRVGHYPDYPDNGAPPMGVPRVGFHGNSSGPGMPSANFSRYKGVGYNTRNVRGMSPERNPNRRGDGYGDGRSNSPERNPMRGRNARSPSPGRRSPSPGRGGRGSHGSHGVHKAVPATNGKSKYYYDDDEYYNQEEGTSRGKGGKGGKSRNSKVPPPNGTNGTSKRNSKKSSNSNASSVKKRNLIIGVVAAILVVIIAVVSAVVAVNSNKAKDNQEDESNEVFDVKFPTSSPTYQGLFYCPEGYIGMVPIRGCGGYQYCVNGEPSGDVIECFPGTLYDVKLNICDHAENVRCSSTPIKVDEGGSGGSPSGDGTPNTPRPTPKPVEDPSSNWPYDNPNDPLPPSPTDSGSDSENQSGETVDNGDSGGTADDWMGPVTTYNHELTFFGISSLGGVASFERDLENYLNIFYAGSGVYNIEGYGTLGINGDGDYILESLLEVKVAVNVMTFSVFRDRRMLLEREEAEVEGNIRHRLQSGSGIAVTYEQSTEYRTTDPNIPVDSIVAHPFQPEYMPTFIEYMKSTDPVFNTLETVEFVLDNSNVGTDNTVENEVPLVPVTSAPTNKPTMPPTLESTIAETMSIPETSRPTKEPTRPPTSPPTKEPTGEPTPSPTKATPDSIIPAFPEYATVQGLLWYDTNADGLWQSAEPPAQQAFVNLRQCEANAMDKWVATTTSNNVGQFQFLGVKEGWYYLEFFRPTNDYQFTIQGASGKGSVGGGGSVIDSDADETSGKSDCMLVTPGFDTLTNAGFVEIEGGEESLAPSPRPTEAVAGETESDSASSYYCAEVTPSSSGNMDFEFFGCATPCPSKDDSQCPGELRCFPSSYCVGINNNSP